MTHCARAHAFPFHVVCWANPSSADSSAYVNSGGSGRGSGSEPGRVRAPHNSCDQPLALTFRDGSCDPIPWQTSMYRGRGMP